MMVPPVPTPAMNASGFRPWNRSCHHISGPVVSSWAAMLSRLENCRGRKDPGVFRAAASAADRDPGIAAGRLEDRRPRIQQAGFRTLPEDVQRHAILDAAGHVQVLGLGVQSPPLTPVGEIDYQERRVADETGETVEPAAMNGFHWLSSPVRPVSPP
jgi:hypothetical protein